jgi:hypothetical protein
VHNISILRSAKYTKTQSTNKLLKYKIYQNLKPKYKSTQLSWIFLSIRHMGWPKERMFEEACVEWLGSALSQWSTRFRPAWWSKTYSCLSDLVWQLMITRTLRWASFEGFRSIENKKIPTKTNNNKPRSDLWDTKQWAREIRSTYPCRSHSGNVQMNVVSVVILACPPRDPIRSKRHNGRDLRALHTYSAATTPPPRSSKVRWSDRWDQQHDGVVLMVESICGQGFAYMHEVEEERQKNWSN